MKIILILGSGNCGASAFNDYLLAREDFQDLFHGGEFRLVNDPDGIDELYNGLYKNFSINTAANKVLNFKNFVNNLYNSEYNKKYNLYTKELISTADNFIRNISYLNYNGSPQFFLDKMTIYEKMSFYFRRFLLRQNAKDINLLNMTIPCSEEKFLEFTKNFIFDNFKSHKNFDKNKHIVIEQGGNYFNPISSTKYYGENRQIIFVKRDPRAIFWSMKRRGSLSYPGHSVELFTKWYVNIMETINNQEINKVITIKFETFFENFYDESKKLCDQLGIDKKIDSNFDLNHTLKNLYKFENNLSSYDKSYLEKNLKKYI